MSTRIELITTKSIININLTGSEKVEINWGDGTNNTYKVPETCSHNYNNNVLFPIDSHKVDTLPIKPVTHKIVIIGDNITGLFCDDNELTDLTGKSTTLETLSCSRNNLTNLYADGFEKLQSLNCTNNQLSDKALSKLFDSLPKVSSGKIFIDDNPGVNGDCNVEIATEKGWIVICKTTKFMTLVTTESHVNFGLEGSGSILVDWGDSTCDAYVLPTKCAHDYKIHKFDHLGQTIKIFNVNKNRFVFTCIRCSGNGLIGLEFCSDNKLLQSFNAEMVELQRTPAVIEDMLIGRVVVVDCRNNQLSSKALDSLFNSLPKFSSNLKMHGELFIEGNLGVESCNVNVAIEKGWIVDYKPNKMILVTAGDNVSFVLGGSGYVLVNWGDGTNNIYRAPECMCIHHYDCSGEHTITIIGGTITSLKCGDNELKRLDVSKNINLEELLCNNNQLTSLMINHNVNLRALECIKNQIATLDISSLTKLVTLDCGHNLISFLDVSNNLALEILSCGGNRLTHLVVCGFANLHTLSCENNLLTLLYCYNNQLTRLDFSGNIELETLHCGGNKLKSLDVKGLTKLKFLNYAHNESLLAGNLNNQENPVLEQLYFYGNNVKISDLLICDFENLRVLNCANNSFSRIYCHNNPLLGSLDVSNIVSLEVLNCCNNKLPSLDVRESTKLRELICYCNTITSLDVSKLTNLKNLTCNHNNLTSLDVSNNTEIDYLQCHANLLTSLDVSSLKKLRSLWCSGVPLDLSENTVLEYLFCPGYPLTRLDVSNNTALKELKCFNSGVLTELDVSKNTALQTLWCYSLDLTELDVSKNNALKELKCFNNRLTELDVSKNTALQTLLCYWNVLTELDVSKNTALQTLWCYGNRLGVLDVSKNTVLEKLLCPNNVLTELIVCNNGSIKEINCAYTGLGSGALNNLFESLPCRCRPVADGLTPQDEYGILKITGNDAVSCDKGIAEKKCWIVVDV